MKFKVILAGYEGSKRILPASSYLIKKYFKEADVYFLNYGDYNGKLFTGTYVGLADKQSDEISWSEYMSNYLKGLDDKYIIFGLDDYLLSHKVDTKAIDKIDMNNWDIVKLCSDANLEDLKYSCTTQYTIWDRELLINILSKVVTAWQFEDYGSIYLNSLFKRIDLVPAMKYPSNSSISSKWDGVKLEGNEHDLDEIKGLYE